MKCFSPYDVSGFFFFQPSVSSCSSFSSFLFVLSLLFPPLSPFCLPLPIAGGDNVVRRLPFFFSQLFFRPLFLQICQTTATTVHFLLCVAESGGIFFLPFCQLLILVLHLRFLLFSSPSFPSSSSASSFPFFCSPQTTTGVEQPLSGTFPTLLGKSMSKNNRQPRVYTHI